MTAKLFRTDFHPIEITGELSTRLANMSLLCAFFVVCMHVWGRAEGFFSYIIYMTYVDCVCRIAVPFFFLCSGFLLAGHFCDKGWYRVQLTKRLANLGCPFLFWNVAWLVISFMVMLLANEVHITDIEKIIFNTCAFGKGNLKPVGFDFFGGWILTALGLNPFGLPYVQQLWYIRSLLILVALSPVLCRLAKFEWLFVLFVAYALICPFGGDLQANLLGRFRWLSFFRITLSLEGLFYFVLGIYLRNSPPPRPIGKCVFSVSFLSVLLIVLSFMLMRSKYLTMAMYCKWTTIPLLLFTVWSLMPGIHLPRWLISNAFGVYLVHRCVVWGLDRFYPFGATGLLILTVKWFVVFALSVCCVQILRFCKLSRLCLGGR